MQSDEKVLCGEICDLLSLVVAVLKVTQLNCPARSKAVPTGSSVYEE